MHRKILIPKPGKPPSAATVGGLVADDHQVPGPVSEQDLWLRARHPDDPRPWPT
jgi:hypothetical protein